MEVTLLGIVIAVKERADVNAKLGISRSWLSPSKVTELSCTVRSKAPTPISETLLGIVIDPKELSSSAT